MISNILTIDVEEYYHLNYSSMTQLPDQFTPGQVKVNTETLLDVCAQYGAQASFFFLGSVAEKYPELVRRTHTEGHEVASHGYGHKLVNEQSRAEFYEDVKKSLDILQDITGKPVKGYRAPSWSISERTPWAYEVLTELGLVYDASLFPFSTFLYGDSQAPTAPFVQRIHEHKLCEIPGTVLELFGQRLPFGGGFFFRFFPYWVTRLATLITNRQGRPVIYYLHPREIDKSQPRLPLPKRDYFITYVNLSGTLRKLRKVLSSSPTISIYQHLELSGLMSDDSPNTKTQKREFIKG
jgi:polysaccharide deacetylase family protein (PEP-CTERM system associated)